MKKQEQRDYYQILHVHPSADPAIIKASYRTLMQKLRNHPDLGGDQNSAALINEAYAVLSDPGARAQYDIALRSGSVGLKSSMFSSQTQNPNTEKTLCLFCKQPNVIPKLHPTDKELNCARCLSPLRFIDFDPEWIGRRAARSVKQNMIVNYRLNAAGGSSMTGVVDDLSPTGMRFSSDRALRMGDIIKLDTHEISAVACVMRSQGEGGLHATAVKFLSLKIHNSRGTFISQKV